MKNTLKKAISVVLAAIMLVSLCTVAISTASAEELTCNDLGVTDGDSVALYDDPTGTGYKVFKLYSKTSRPNFELADPTDGTKKFEPVAGTTYTVMFDYYFDSNSGSADPFQLYYGAQSKYESTYSKVGISGINSGFSSEFIGDGKWHTGSITFEATAVKGQIDGVADQVLPYLYLTYYSAKGVSGYLKNIRIITEAEINSASCYTYTFAALFDENGAPKTDATYEDGDGEIAPLFTADAKLDADGNTVFVPKSDTFNATYNSRTTITNYDYINIVNDNGVSTGSTGGSGAWCMWFNVKYKVVKIGESGFAGLGIGRASNTAASTCVYNTVKYTETTDDWQYFTAPIRGEANENNKLRITVAGIGSEIVIDSVQVAKVNYNSTKFKAVVYNDNGEVTLDVGYVGTDLTEIADNGVFGEASLGWCSDSYLTTATTKVPASEGTDGNAYVTNVFAKYPTVSIEKFNFQKVVLGPDTNCSNTSFNGDSFTYTSNANVGMMLPAYDGRVTVGTGGYDHYQFKSGAHYRVVIEISGITMNTAEGSSALALIGATAAGSGGARDTGVAHKDINGFAVTETSPETATLVFDFNRASGNSNWDICGMGLRCGSNKASYTLTVDKIYITDMSLIEDKAVIATSIRNEDTTGESYVSAGIRFRARVTADVKANATEIGFVAVPTAYLVNEGVSIEHYVEMQGNLAVSGVVYDGTNEILYSEQVDDYGRDSYDYQMIITGLTREGSTTSLCGAELSVALYTVIDGVKTYTKVVAYSYNDVVALMAAQ